LEKALKLSSDEKQDEELEKALQLSALEMYGIKTDNNLESDMALKKAIAESLKDNNPNNRNEGTSSSSDRQNKIPIKITEE
jgi:hypothetical protein